MQSQRSLVDPGWRDGFECVQEVMDDLIDSWGPGYGIDDELSLVQERASWDIDQDHVCRLVDNCANLANPDQSNRDGDRMMRNAIVGQYRTMFETCKR